MEIKRKSPEIVEALYVVITLDVITVLFYCEVFLVLVNVQV